MQISVFHFLLWIKIKALWDSQIFTLYFIYIFHITLDFLFYVRASFYCTAIWSVHATATFNLCVIISHVHIKGEVSIWVMQFRWQMNWGFFFLAECCLHEEEYLCLRFSTSLQTVTHTHDICECCALKTCFQPSTGHNFIHHRSGALKWKPVLKSHAQPETKKKNK